MTNTRRSVLLLVLAGLWTVWILRLYYNGPHLDLTALYLAGWLWGDGQTQAIFAAPPDVFGPDQPALWAQAWTAAGGPADFLFTAYVYPPIWAALLAPVTHGTDPMAFFHAVFLWHIAAALLAAWLGWHLSHRTPLSPGWALALLAILGAGTPALNTFMLNQPQITILAMVLLAFVLVHRGHDLSGGAVLGLAAAIKLSPILFALLFVLNRRWRALGAALVVSGGLALASLLVAGWPLHATFLDRLSQIDAMVVQTRVNFSLETLLYQVSEILNGHPVVEGRKGMVFTATAPTWINLLISAAFLAALAALWLTTRRMPDATRLPVQLIALSLITALFGPLSWAHYFLLPLLLLPALFTIMPTSRAWGWSIAFIATTSFPLFMATHVFNHLIMATAVLPALTALALLWVTLAAAHKASRQGSAEGAGRP
ncbi:glycosyltransferase family 87 protein [Marimonas lutisalis]|uniref:glycosyltransferase family 87 protein n=1 Tax=Marimonas lutisalis TaxID=2545756 RepID=UPI0010FA0486|nr:glycosyltransferase family 87 protein [Marimonas lutisalis]